MQCARPPHALASTDNANCLEDTPQEILDAIGEAAMEPHVDETTGEISISLPWNLLHTSEVLLRSQIDLMRRRGCVQLSVTAPPGYLPAKHVPTLGRTAEETLITLSKLGKVPQIALTVQVTDASGKAESSVTRQAILTYEDLRIYFETVNLHHLAVTCAQQLQALTSPESEWQRVALENFTLSVTVDTTGVTGILWNKFDRALQAIAHEENKVLIIGGGNEIAHTLKHFAAMKTENTPILPEKLHESLTRLGENQHSFVLRLQNMWKSWGRATLLTTKEAGEHTFRLLERMCCLVKILNDLFPAGNQKPRCFQRMINNLLWLLANYKLLCQDFESDSPFMAQCTICEHRGPCAEDILNMLDLGDSLHMHSDRSCPPNGTFVFVMQARILIRHGIESREVTMQDLRETATRLRALESAMEKTGIVVPPAVADDISELETTHYDWASQSTVGFPYLENKDDVMDESDAGEFAYMLGRRFRVVEDQEKCFLGEDGALSVKGHAPEAGVPLAVARGVHTYPL